METETLLNVVVPLLSPGTAKARQVFCRCQYYIKIRAGIFGMWDTALGGLKGNKHARSTAGTIASHRPPCFLPLILHVGEFSTTQKCETVISRLPSTAYASLLKMEVIAESDQG
jgi:hypothetical protein